MDDLHKNSWYAHEEAKHQEKWLTEQNRLNQLTGRKDGI